MQKIKLIPHLFLEIMQQMDGTLDILGNLGIDSHIHQKEEKKKKQRKNKQTNKQKKTKISKKTLTFMSTQIINLIPEFFLDILHFKESDNLTDR